MSTLRRLHLLGFGLSVLVASGFSTSADTLVGGTISTDTTWTLAASPYVITSDIVIAGGASPTLTVQPGVVVKARSGKAIVVTGPGRLLAVGAPGQSIVFTTDQGTVTSGYWRGISFNSTSSPSSQLQYVTVEGAGYDNGTTYSGLWVFAGSPTFDNLTLRTNNYAGLAVSGGTPSLTNSTITGTTGVGFGINMFSPGALAISNVSITGNVGAAMTLRDGASFASVTGLTATGNGTDAVLYKSQAVSVNQTWRSFGLPYIPDTSINVAGAATPVLTIQPGVTVKMRNGAWEFTVGSGNPGRLVASGTSGQPIKFTTIQTTVTAGYWVGVVLRSTSTPSSQLQYVTVEGAGWDVGATYAGMHVVAGSPTLDNITLRTNNYAGLMVSGGTPSLTNSTITGTTGVGFGINMFSPGALTISNVSITGNAGGAMTLRDGASFASVTGLTATGNGTDAVLYKSQAVSVNQTWRSFGLPYIPDTAVNVAGPATPVLTIEPGVTVKMRNGANEFTVGSGNPGRLVATGTSGQPIKFSTIQTTVTAGYWVGVVFRSTSTPSSQLQYVTVEGAGWDVGATYAGMHVVAGSPTLDNVTLRTNAYAGLMVSGGTPSLSNSAISGTTVASYGYGINMFSPGALTVSNVSITGNAGAAMTLRDGASFASVTGLTATGNGTDAVLYKSQAVSVNQTWRSFGLPYIPDSYVNVAGASSPTLTLEPGVTVKMRNSNDFTIGYQNLGRLIAQGTSTSPIAFTTLAPPVRGLWRGLFLNPPTVQSLLSYVTVEGAGLDIYGWSTGIGIADGNHVLDHVTIRTNLGSGIKVTGGNPSIVNCTISGNGVGILNAINPPRQIKVPLNYWGAADGPNAGVGTGTGDAISGLVKYDPFLVAAPVLPQYITGADLVERRFNPADGHRGTWTLTSSSSGSWTITLRNSVNALVRNLATTGSPATLVWDGKNDGGADQPDGNYTYQLDNVAGVNAATSGKGRIFLDRTLAYAITSPGAAATLSNVYQSGSSDVPILGTAVETGLSNWTLDYGGGASPTAWAILGTGTSAVSNALLGTLATYPLTNGLYTIRLTLVDTYGSVVSTSIGPTLANFRVTPDTQQFNAATGVVNYTSIVPFALTEAIQIRTPAGVLVTTPVNASRGAGTYVDAWNASGVPDGGYVFTATATDGVHNMTLDQSSQYGTYAGYPPVSFSSYDPFNNQPLVITYQMYQPGQGTIYLASVSEIPDTCGVGPTYCPLNHAYLETGYHTLSWAGTDGSGTFRPDLKYLAFRNDQTTFPINAVVVFGRRPVISNLRVTPPDFSGAGATQNATFTLTTYQSQPAAVTVSYFNQSSLSTLRTISIPSQAPGNVTVPWDGRAVDGSPVAAGPYTVTVTVVDSLGNSVSSQILTRVEY